MAPNNSDRSPGETGGVGASVCGVRARKRQLRFSAQVSEGIREDIAMVPVHRPDPTAASGDEKAKEDTAGIDTFCDGERRGRR